MKMADPLLKYKIGISLIPGVGCANAKKLIAYLGGVKEVFAANKTTLLKVPGIGTFLANSIAHSDVLDRASQEVDFITKNKINTYYFLDDTYPSRLKECEDAPIMLYAKGNINFDSNKVISIVGTRKPSILGTTFCNDFTAELVKHGHEPIIVSGLAYGIDIAAHKAALANNLQTISVMAHGLDKLYPSIHRDVASQITKHGAIVTEFISGTIADKQNFVKRNRIIAGLSDATIVVESALKGGSLITADIANSYNRDVLAVPGRIGDKPSAGCNWLIKTNRAAMLESVKDLEYILSWDVNEKPGKVEQQKLFEALTDEAVQILDFIRKAGEMELDRLAMKMHMPVNKISSILLTLEFDGFVKVLPGKIYVAT